MEALPRLAEREENLRAGLAQCWNPKKKIYSYRDYQTHLSLPGEMVHEFIGPGRITSRKRFSQPRRLIIHLEAGEERSYAVTATLTGYNAEGEVVETMGPRSFNWHGARHVPPHRIPSCPNARVRGMATKTMWRLPARQPRKTAACFYRCGPARRGCTSEQLVKTPPSALHAPVRNPLTPPTGPAGRLPGLHTSFPRAAALEPLIGEDCCVTAPRPGCRRVTRWMDAIITSLKNHRHSQYYDAETAWPRANGGTFRLAPWVSSLTPWTEAVGPKRNIAGRI